MAPLLDDAQVRDALTSLDGWTRDGDAITSKPELPSFAAAIEAVVAIAEAAEAADHHPDIDIRYRTLTLRLSTHSAGGLTTKDIDLATEIDRIIAARV